MACAKHERYMHRVPRVVVVDPRMPERDAVSAAVRVLRAGRLVGLPTETVYGLGARALDESAVARVFQAKGRPPHHPLIAHVLDEEHAKALAASWPTNASRLARAFWPGPLTIVVERARHVPAGIAGGGHSIAVRAPSHAVARAVIRMLGEPVAAPSANRYQGVSATTASHVVKELGDAVDLVLDAGECEAGIESTVVDVRGDVPRVLRPGALDTVVLRTCLPDLEAHVEHADGAEARASPGMEARHYAPRATILLADTAEAAKLLATRVAASGQRVGLVVRAADDGREESSISPEDQAALLDVVVRTLAATARKYARGLYRTLHELDDEGVDVIVVQAVPIDEGWRAIADRLHRARRA